MEFDDQLNLINWWCLAIDYKLDFLVYKLETLFCTVCVKSQEYLKEVKITYFPNSLITYKF